MFKLIIAGSRGYNYYQGVKNSFYKYIEDNNIKLEDIEIVSGNARGPDSLAIDLAKELGLLCKIFPADWDRLGKSAGMNRNKEMAEYANGLLAIWDGSSKGTGHMIEIATEKNLLVQIVRY